MQLSAPHKHMGLHYLLIHTLYWPTLTAYYSYGAAYLYSIGLTSSVTGLVLAGASALSAAAQGILAAFADRSKTVSTGTIAVLLALPGTVLLFVLWLAPLALTLRVILYTLAWTLLLALQFLINSFGMECAEAGIAADFGKSRAGGSLGYGITSYFMGILCARAGISAALPVVAGLSTLLLIALIPWRLPPRGLVAPARAEDKASAKGFLRRYPRFCILLIGLLLAMIAYCTTNNYLVRLVERLGGGSKELGVTFTICSLSEIPVGLGTIWLVRRFGSGRLMRVTALALSAKMLAVALAPGIGWLYASMLLQVLSYALFIPASVYYVDACMTPSDKVKGQATITLLIGMANAVGALTGGLLLDNAGVAGMLIFCVVCSVAGSIVMCIGTENVQDRI